MSKAAVKPIPEGMHSLTPHLVCAGAADAIAFYTRAFGAVEQSRMPGPGGSLMHAQVRIGDSTLMLVDENKQWGALSPKSLGGTPVTIHLYVPDADAVFRQAIAAGATAKMEPADMFWGDRYGMLIDPFGHQWSIATHMRDLTGEEIEAGMKAQFAQNCQPD
jgi:PhnB protein